MLAGCVSNPNQQTRSSAPATDGTKTRTQGAVAGAIVGGVLGRLVGKDDKSTAMGVLIGGVLGYGLGDHVAKRKEAYEKEEDYLNAVADNANRVAADTDAYNKALKQEISRLLEAEKELKSQQVAAKSQQIAAKSRQNIYMARLQRTTELIEQADNALASVRSEIKMQDTALQASPRSSGSEGFVKVSNSKRVLESQERNLELAKAKLLAIDRRRVY